MKDNLQTQLIDLQELIEHLTLYNKQLEQYTLSTSHNLQQPLIAIEQQAMLLEKKCGTRLETHERATLNAIKNAALEARNLVSDFLKLSRCVPGEKIFSPVNLNEVIAQIVQKLEPALEEIGGRIEVGRLPTINNSKVFMIYLFENLLSNAIKYKGSKALKVSVQCIPQQDDWLFSVKDNGKGVPAYRKKTIFQPGIRELSTITGSGMGLYIAKKVVQNCGGDIWVDSEQDKGSTFYFTLPGF